MKKPLFSKNFFKFVTGFFLIIVSALIFAVLVGIYGNGVAEASTLWQSII